MAVCLGAEVPLRCWLEGDPVVVCMVMDCSVGLEEQHPGVLLSSWLQMNMTAPPAGRPHRLFAWLPAESLPLAVSTVALRCSGFCSSDWLSSTDCDFCLSARIRRQTCTKKNMFTKICWVFLFCSSNSSCFRRKKKCSSLLKTSCMPSRQGCFSGFLLI